MPPSNPNPLTDEKLPPPITQIHLPPPYRRGRGDTAVLIFLGAVIVLGIWKMGAMLNSPEPFALPPTTPAVTPIDTTQEVQHIVIDNLATTAPEPTTTPYPIAPQPTTFVETLPLCDSDKATPRALCAPLRVRPVPTSTPYQECNSQSFHDSWNVVEPCLKPAATETPVSTLERIWR